MLNEIVHCENCLRRKEDGICERWHEYVPLYGFCHMAVKKDREQDYRKWLKDFRSLIDDEPKDR